MNLNAFHPQPLFPPENQGAATGSSSASLTVTKGRAYLVSVTQNTFVRFTSSANAQPATNADTLITPARPLVLVAPADTLAFIQDTTAGRISVSRIEPIM